jgi:cellobiose-specific phosphotransferase system component IIB
VEKTL